MCEDLINYKRKLILIYEVSIPWKEKGLLNHLFKI